MNSNKKAVFFFCSNPQIDPVASHVFNVTQQNISLKKTDVEVDGKAVLEYVDDSGSVFHYVRTERVVSNDYNHYLPILNKHFNNYDFAAIVNWHEGKNAPDRILSIHTTGDTPSGIFGNINPVYMRNIFCSMEKNRVMLGLNDFITTTEATHWSGIPCGSPPELIKNYPVPIVDIEIGSTQDSWSNSRAVEVIYRSILNVFNCDEMVYSLLCVGGVHIESSFCNVMLHSNKPIAISHILANQWIVTGEYDTEGPQKLEACIESIVGGIHGIVFHDNLKGVYKNHCRSIADKLGISAFKHQLLRHPENIPI